MVQIVLKMQKYKLCEQHLDNQAELFKCQVLKYKVNLDCEFQNLYTNNIETDEVRKLSKILKKRQELIEDQQNKWMNKLKERRCLKALVHQTGAAKLKIYNMLTIY